MTIEELEDLFEKHDGEYFKFDRVVNKLATRADLHAFNLLDKLLPLNEKKGDIISAAEHDKIWLGIDLDDLTRVASEADIIDLIRCGVMLESEGLSMFA